MTLETRLSASPLRLSRYYLKSLEYGLYDRYAWGKVPEGVEIEVPALKVSVAARQNPNDQFKWRIDLTLTLEEPAEENFPYRFNAEMVGFFTFDEDFPAEKMEGAAKVIGPAFLYGTARDMVSAVTSRSPFPPLILNTTIFTVEEVGEPKPKAAKAATKPKPTRKLARKK